MSTHNLCFEHKCEKYQNVYLKTFCFWWWNFQRIWNGMFSWCTRLPMHKELQQKNRRSETVRRNTIGASLCSGDYHHVYFVSKPLCVVCILSDVSNVRSWLGLGCVIILRQEFLFTFAVPYRLNWFRVLTLLLPNFVINNHKTYLLK